MRIIPSIPHVLHLEFRNRTELTLSMARLQEFFESPHEHIRGKVFTLEAFLATYYAPGHEIDYFAYWEGFNVPKTTVDDFFNRYGEGLTLRESVIKHAWKSGEYQYLIAVEENGDVSTLDHEIAHARYAMDEEYRKKCNDVVLNINQMMFSKLCEHLAEQGYPDFQLGRCGDRILVDEIHAYLRTSTDEELIETFPDIRLSELQPYIDQLKAIA